MFSLNATVLAAKTFDIGIEASNASSTTTIQFISPPNQLSIARLSAS